MTEKDIIFKFYPAGVRPDPDCFCHYGWEGNGAFAIWKYACAYYDSAEILFDKFKESKGDYIILDGVGITICNLYRHFVELSIKFLYFNFNENREEELKAFLEKGHCLNQLWKETKPILKKLRDRVGSSVSLGCLEHYILEFDKFDPNGEGMRYPMKNNLNQMHEPLRLDIYNLRDRMVEYFQAFRKIADDLDHQLFADVPISKLKEFENKYELLKEEVLAFIAEMRILIDVEESEDKGKPRFICLSEIALKPDRRLVYLKQCSDDLIVILDALYYTGRSIKCKELTLPKNPYEAKADVFKLCVLNMKHDGIEFGKPLNEEINIWSKDCKVLNVCISSAVKVLEWNNEMALERLKDIQFEYPS